MIYMLNISSVKIEQEDLEGCLNQCQTAIDVGRANQIPSQMIAKAYERMGNAHAKHNNFQQARLCYETAQENHQTQQIVLKIQEMMLHLCQQCGAPASNKCKACHITVYYSEECRMKDSPFHRVVVDVE
jgi:hypothetical protein